MVIKEKNKPGKMNEELLEKFQVPHGIERRLLKQGNPLTLKNGQIIQPEQVKALTQYNNKSWNLLTPSCFTLVLIVFFLFLWQEIIALFMKENKSSLTLFRHFFCVTNSLLSKNDTKSGGFPCINSIK